MLLVHRHHTVCQRVMITLVLVLVQIDVLLLDLTTLQLVDAQDTLTPLIIQMYLSDTLPDIIPVTPL